MSPTHQDLSNDTTSSQIKSRVPNPLRIFKMKRILKGQLMNENDIVGISNPGLFNGQP